MSINSVSSTAVAGVTCKPAARQSGQDLNWLLQEIERSHLASSQHSDQHPALHLPAAVAVQSPPTVSLNWLANTGNGPAGLTTLHNAAPAIHAVWRIPEAAPAPQLHTPAAAAPAPTVVYPYTPCASSSSSHGNDPSSKASRCRKWWPRAAAAEAEVAAQAPPQAAARGLAARPIAMAEAAAAAAAQAPSSVDDPLPCRSSRQWYWPREPVHLPQLACGAGLASVAGSLTAAEPCGGGSNGCGAGLASVAGGLTAAEPCDDASNGSGAGLASVAGGLTAAEPCDDASNGSGAGLACVAGGLTAAEPCGRGSDGGGATDYELEQLLRDLEVGGTHREESSSSSGMVQQQASSGGHGDGGGDSRTGAGHSSSRSGNKLEIGETPSPITSEVAAAEAEAAVEARLSAGGGDGGGGGGAGGSVDRFEWLPTRFASSAADAPAATSRDADDYSAAQQSAGDGPGKQQEEAVVVVVEEEDSTGADPASDLENTTTTQLRGPTQQHYAGVFLDDDSCARLLAACPPAHDIIHADHLTLRYRPELDAALMLPLGAVLRLDVKLMATDGRLQVAYAKTPAWLQVDTGQPPHITVSVAPGVPPRDAGALCRRALFGDVADMTAQPEDQPLVLQGRVGIKMLDGRVLYDAQHLYTQAYQHPCGGPGPRVGPALHRQHRAQRQGQQPPLGSLPGSSSDDGGECDGGGCDDEGDSDGAAAASSGTPIHNQQQQQQRQQAPPPPHHHHHHRLVQQPIRKYLKLASPAVQRALSPRHGAGAPHHHGSSAATAAAAAAEQQQEGAGGEPFRLLPTHLGGGHALRVRQPPYTSASAAPLPASSSRQMQSEDISSHRSPMPRPAHPGPHSPLQSSSIVYGSPAPAGAALGDAGPSPAAPLPGQGGEAQQHRGMLALHANAKRLLYNAAARCRAGGHYAAAKSMDERAHVHAALARASRQAASKAAFRQVNSSIVNTFCIDLHGLHTPEALQELRRYIGALRVLGHPGDVVLRVITGKGLHSPHGQARLLPAVAAKLQEWGYEFTNQQGNGGVLEVRLGSSSSGNAGADVSGR